MMKRVINKDGQNQARLLLRYASSFFTMNCETKYFAPIFLRFLNGLFKDRWTNGKTDLRKDKPTCNRDASAEGNFSRNNLKIYRYGLNVKKNELNVATQIPKVNFRWILSIITKKFHHHGI